MENDEEVVSTWMGWWVGSRCVVEQQVGSSVQWSDRWVASDEWDRRYGGVMAGDDRYRTGRKVCSERAGMEGLVFGGTCWVEGRKGSRCGVEEHGVDDKCVLIHSSASAPADELPVTTVWAAAVTMSMA